MSDDATRLAAWRRRRRRLRWLLRKLPLRSNVHRYPGVKWFARGARSHAFLWSFRTAHLVPALYFGSVLMLLPTYGLQIPIALGAALLLRANLTVAVGLTLLNNPLTAAPIYLATDRIGLAVLHALGLADGVGAVARHAAALVIGAVVAGLGLGLVLDLGRQAMGWEARRFRAALAQPPA
jgi:uncharacterized protein (DUF2062 family)